MKMVITVRGKTRECGFEFDGDVRDLQSWWDEGFDVAMVENEIPTWIPAGTCRSLVRGAGLIL